MTDIAEIRRRWGSRLDQVVAPVDGSVLAEVTGASAAVRQLRRGPGSPFNTSRYGRLRRAYIAASAPVCAWEQCPVPDRRIDVRLSGSHRWGPTIDRRHPTSAGANFWDTSNWQVMHRQCNRAKGATVAVDRRYATSPSREW